MYTPASYLSIFFAVYGNFLLAFNYSLWYALYWKEEHYINFLEKFLMARFSLNKWTLLSINSDIPYTIIDIWISFSDIPTDVIAVPDTTLSRRVNFVIGVNGRSVEDTYFDGDKVPVEKTQDVPVGKIGIFIRCSEAL